MKYRTKVGNKYIEIAPEENPHWIFDKVTYTAWQCDHNYNRCVGWGGYDNAMKALADVKAKLK